ncbi:MAG: MYXO-CTERM sorting domain-containing protein [Myxococcota bacterium]
MCRPLASLMVVVATLFVVDAAWAQDAGMNTCSETRVAGTGGILVAPIDPSVPINTQVVVDTTSIPAGMELRLLEDNVAGPARFNELGPPEGVLAPEGLHVAELQGLRHGPTYKLVLWDDGGVAGSPLATFVARRTVDSATPTQPTITTAFIDDMGTTACPGNVTFTLDNVDDDQAGTLLMDVALRFGPPATNPDGTAAEPEALDPQRDAVAVRVPVSASGTQSLSVPLPSSGERNFTIQVRLVDTAGRTGAWSKPVAATSQQQFFCDVDCGMMGCDAAGLSDAYGAAGVLVAVALLRSRRRR